MTDLTELAQYEIRDATDALAFALDLQNDHTEETISALRKLLDERIPGCEKNYLALKYDDASIERELPDEDLPFFTVSLFGTELFEGTFGQKLRHLLLDKMFEKNPRFVTRFLPSDKDLSEWTEEQSQKLLESIKKKPWIPGSRTAREFVRILGFPVKFAGMSSEKKPENVENIEKRIFLGNLLPFQSNLKAQMLFLLKKEYSKENRGILQLPTGSGKTRIAVEAIIEFWKEKPATCKFVMWVAQTEELCEQAFQSFKQVWEEQGTEGEILSLYRTWGGRGLPDTADEGIIIAGIHQLDSLIPKSENGDDTEKENELSRIRNIVGAVIVDEAHSSTTTMYRRLFNSLEMSINPNDSKQIPLLGITATPYRSGDYQTGLLLKQYNKNILSPNQKFEPKDNFDDNWRDYYFVLDRLTDDKVLSVPHYYYPSSGTVFQMNEIESKSLETQHLLPDSLLDRVGKDPSRNLIVYKIIKEWADKKGSILFFGANINQAVMMKEFLNQNGIKSAVITAETKYGSRHKYVKMFKEKKIQVLCNYNVLTTGFDSPKVDTVIIARPTGSRLMYEQMVGRGLRGPLFGGTPTCDIITVLDNILNYSRKRIKQGHEEFAETVKNISQEERDNITKIREGYEDATESFELTMPVIGEIFTDDEIQQRFQIQNRGGIRFTHKHNFVILIDSNLSNYQDRVDEETGTITYIGTGEEDQGFDTGIGKFNAKVRDPNSTLLYFQKLEKNKIIFKYHARYDSHSFSNEKNIAGKERRVIRFKLKIIKKLCPNCNDTIASNDQEIEERFGYRTTNGKTIPQSWCKVCRNF